MSNPSVTATIAVDDKASPALRELARLAKMIAQETAQALNGGSGDNYARSLNRANAAAREHISALGTIRKIHHEIASTIAGVAGMRFYRGAKAAITSYLPFDKEVRYQTAIQNFSPADQKLLGAQRVEAARRFGVMPADTLHAQQAFVTRNLNAQITKAATDQALLLAKALNVDVAEASKIVESITFAQGIHLKDPATAGVEMRRSADRAAIAAKAGAMSPDDVSQFAKYGMGMASSAGISADQAYAIGMTLKRANVGGDESGVFMRQLSARLMAPTKQAFEAFAHMGIRYEDFATQGNVSPEAIDASLRRRYGKGLSDKGLEGLRGAFSDDSRDVLGSREQFTAAVREAVEAGGEKLSKMDQKHLVDTALRQYDLAKSGLRGGELLDAVLSKASPKDFQALIGDKQGGRAVMLLSALDQYREYLEKLSHGDGYAQKIAEERMQGLAAAADRLSASLDTASKQIVAANQGWLTPLADAAGKLAGMFIGLSERSKEVLSIAAGLASLAGLASAGATIVSVIGSLGGLAVSANIAAASLARISGTTAVTGTAAALSASSTVTGAAARTSGVLGTLSKLFSWAAVASVIGPVIWDRAGQEAAGTDDTKGGGAANYRRRLRMRREAAMWQRGADATPDYLRELVRADVEPGSRSGWQASIASPAGVPSGPAKWGEVTVNGAAELHQNLTIEVRPSAYLESVVKRAESISNIPLSNKLGMGMTGGDNATKPAAAPLTAPTGAQ